MKHRRPSPHSFTAAPVSFGKSEISAESSGPDRAARERLRRCVSRRTFLRGTSLAAMSAALGTVIPYARYMPDGLIPIALADTRESFEIPGKRGLITFNDRPLNAETPAHLLDDDVTPAEYLFVRNHGIPPASHEIDKKSWMLEVTGESCQHPRTFTLAELQTNFKQASYQLLVECAGNGRSEYFPAAPGNQWTTGAVGCPRWTGVRLKEILSICGIKENAVYVAYYGKDKHLSGDPDKSPISRGVPINKALEDETLLAWQMNGRDIPLVNGYPLRLICGGWPGSTCGKWINKIVVRDRVHDGEKMMGKSYRVPCRPVAAGAAVADEDMCIIEAMPVKSLITSPRSGIDHPLNDPIPVRGHAWVGTGVVDRLFVSIDFGMTWRQVEISAPINQFAWQHWTVSLRFPSRGYFEIWARAVDSSGRSQPMVLPGWNPKGYLNNACHRVAVRIV